MGFIESMRLKRGMKELHRLYDRHKPVKQTNWEDVKTVGVLYDAMDPKIAGQVEELYQLLRREDKQPAVLGYLHTKDEKLVPAAHEGFYFFSRRDLDGKQMSRSAAVQHFTEQPFDILFDLNVGHLFPLYAISVLSHAHLKAGLDIPENKHLNLTIQLDITQPQDVLVHYLIDNLKNYVKEIHV